jgi:hypothetical protein
MSYCGPMCARSSRSSDRLADDGNIERDRFQVWPRRRSTAASLVALLILQAILFFDVTRRSFFFLDDYIYFNDAQQQHFLLRYLLTPVLHVYPAPGDRLASLLLQRFAPLNFTVARAILIVFLAGTTVLLRYLVSTFARSDRWWTVALVVPFALSLTLVTPMSWWSAGLPVIPALFFTVVALAAWQRSYRVEGSAVWLWVGVATIAIAAAGAFYLKFLLIPLYLLFLRLVIFPRILGLSNGIRHLWNERMRWVTLAVPPAAFVAVFVLSGLAGRSASGGSRPYVAFFATAWFRAFIPASFMNARVDHPILSISPWVIVVCSQVLFWAVVGATLIRSSLAVRGWALFLFIFVVNVAVVGTDRLPFFGTAIAYALRYYPEVAMFLPLALALGLRQGEERRPELAWERTTSGQTLIGSIVGLYVAGFVIWAPSVVSDYQGVQAKAWYGNLRHDIDAMTQDGSPVRIVDSVTPAYVMENWMEPVDRVSTVLELASVDAILNQVSQRTHLVRDDGHLAEAVFRPLVPMLTPEKTGRAVRIVGGGPDASDGICLEGGGSLRYRPDAAITGQRLAMRVFYSERSRGPVPAQVETGNPDVPTRSIELRPFQSDAELIDLGTSRLQELDLSVPPGDRVCIDRMEIGSLTALSA